MVRHASLFSQLVAVFDRQRFYQLVFRHGSERYAKKYSSWDHFVAMLFCQLAQAKSLREICGGLACCMGKLREKRPQQINPILCKCKPALANVSGHILRYS